MFRRTAMTAGVAGLAIVLAACGSATTGSGLAGLAASPSAVATPTPAATATPAPTPTASPDPTDAPASAPALGRTGRIELPDEGIALTLPDGWVEVNVSADDFESIMASMPEGTYTQAQIDMMKAGFESGMRLMAFDGDGSGSNLNLIVQDMAVPVSMLEAVLPAQVEQLPGVSDLDVSHTTAAGEDALRVTYHLEQPMPDGSTTPVEGTGVYVSANGRTYVVTVSEMGGRTKDADAIFDSLELLP